MPPRKRKASKKKNKKGESHDSNNQQLHTYSNNSSTHSHGSVDDSKSLEERDSDSGELEREEEEEIVDQREVDVSKGEAFEDEVVQVAVEEKSVQNGSGSVHSSAADVAVENPIVVPENFDVEDKEVAVVEEEYEKEVINEFGESKAENDGRSDLVEEAVDNYAQQDPVVEFNESVKAQIIDDEELVKEEVKLAPEQVVSETAESLVVPVPPDVVDLEMTNTVDSSFSQISDVKEDFSSDVEVQKSEQIENPVEVESIVADADKSSYAPAVNNGKEMETDNGTAPVDNITSRAVDNGKELETNKASEDQPLIGSNPLPVRRTSWTGCCGLFEVFSGGSR